MFVCSDVDIEEQAPTLREGDKDDDEDTDKTVQ